MNTILNFPLRPAAANSEAAIQPGRRYRMLFPETLAAGQVKDLADVEHLVQSGVIGAYRLGIDKAEIEAIDIKAPEAQGFVWDADLLSPEIQACLQIEAGHPQSPLQNRLTLLEASLDAPEVRMVNEQPVLTVSPRFELEWSTEVFASQLGLLQLLESTRTLQFEDGDSLVLLDTEALGLGPVLYLSNAGDSVVVKPVCGYQRQGDKRGLTFATSAEQIVPAQFMGKPVASVSVLEKYTMYFMQNAAPEQPEAHIWTPVHLPIVWGWSIRVQQRFDGVWDIFRKKLIMPTPSTEAAALPRWQSNSLRCRPAVAGF